MRTLAIGDVHGCAGALRALLDAVAVASTDTLVMLGDFVDDGPDSNSVIGLVLRLERRCKLVPLLGNHDQMMLEARESPDKLGEWSRSGGAATLKSYRREGVVGTLKDVPRAHWQFLEKRCQKYYQTPADFFVHANAYPDMSLEEQPDYMLRWEQLRESRPHSSGKTMICGHTSQKSGRILDLGFAVCIDTNPAGGGWLTCFEPSTRKFWQANESGELRMDRL